MIIKEVAFGNQHEAFIETRFSDGANIIFSTDNNKGKTILIQAMMYALGNDPFFPSGFEYKEYYYYIQFTIDAKPYRFLRKGDTITIIAEDSFIICNSISEFKYFIHQNIFPIPEIFKDGTIRLVYPSLYYELFFIGQDKRNTSNVIHRGLYSKTDFINMLYSLDGIPYTNKYSDDRSLIESRIIEKKEKIALLKGKVKFIKRHPKIADSYSRTADKSVFDSLILKGTELMSQITSLKKERAREQNRLNIHSSLLDELNSLNRKLDGGKLKCSNCGSDDILIFFDKTSFDVSNSFVRDKIIQSIKLQITIISENIQDLTKRINDQQDRYNSLYSETDDTTKSMLIYIQDIKDEIEPDLQISELMNDIDQLQDALTNNSIDQQLYETRQDNLITSITEEMQKLYKDIDPNGKLSFRSIFSKMDETYSGSEEQEFYFCRLVAFLKYLKHKFPIIIDSYRSGELSTAKEWKMLEIIQQIQNQIILTSTLKQEEYTNLKYDALSYINCIDYSNHQSSRILQSSNVDTFLKIISDFSIHI